MEEYQLAKKRLSIPTENLSHLYRIVGRKDGGGSSVDQSKGLGFGSSTFDKKRKAAH